MIERRETRSLVRYAVVALAAAAVAAAPTPAEASGRPVSPSRPIVVHPRPPAPHGGHGGYYRGYYGGAYGSWGWGWGPSWAWWGSPYWWGPSFGTVAVYQGGRPAPPRHAAVKTDVSPEEAEVYLDGQFVGRADDFDGYPDVLYLGPGSYRLEFRHPLYRTLVKEIDARAGVVVRIDTELQLVPGKGKLDAFDPSDRGTPLGRVFSKDSGGALRRGDPDEPAPGERNAVDVERMPSDASPGGTAEPQAEAAEGATAAPEGRPATAKRGRLRFDVTPRDAVVYVDDRYAGAADELETSSRGLSVAAGKHTVTVVRPGYKPRTVEVVVEPGDTEEIEVALEK